MNYSDPFGLCDDPNDLACRVFVAGMTLLGGTAGFIAGGGVGAAEMALTGGLATPVAVAQTGAAMMGGAALGQAAGESLWRVFSNRDGSAGGSERRPSSAGRMQREVERGQAPRSVLRVDRGRAYKEQDNVHFRGDHALNRDGSWKHGGRELTNKETEWLTNHGWSLPK